MRAALRARLWLRVSPGKDQDEEGQLLPCLRRANLGDRGNPWTVDEGPVEKGGGVYRAHHVHGDDAEHPLRRRVFQDAAKGLFEVLIVWELSRFTRGGVLQLLGDRERLAKLGVRLVSVREEWAENELLLAIAAWQDSEKLRQVREGTARELDAIRARIAKTGYHVGRKSGRMITRLGRPSKFTPELRARARELYNGGARTPGEVARELAREGLGEIATRTVRDIVGAGESRQSAR